MLRLFIAGILICATLAATALGLQDRATPATPAALNAPLTLGPLGQLNAVHAAVVRELGMPSHQIEVVAADLNRDGRSELLIAPAPPSADLHVPRRPLLILAQATDGRWVTQDSGISCRPVAFGAFATDGWWDLRCAQGARQRVLRWQGTHYAVAGGTR